jgi:hypothetical protein
MIPVRLDIPLRDRDTGETSHASKTMNLHGVPSVGHDVTISEGGWSEPVRGVYWDTVDGSVSVELGYDTYGYVEYSTEVEDLTEIAREAGWEVT